MRHMGVCVGVGAGVAVGAGVGVATAVAVAMGVCVGVGDGGAGSTAKPAPQMLSGPAAPRSSAWLIRYCRTSWGLNSGNLWRTSAASPAICGCCLACAAEGVACAEKRGLAACDAHEVGLDSAVRRGAAAAVFFDRASVLSQCVAPTVSMPELALSAGLLVLPPPVDPTIEPFHRHNLYPAGQVACPAGYLDVCPGRRLPGKAIS